MNRQGPEESQPAAEPIISAPLGRRSVLKGMGAGAVTVGAGGLLAACSSGIKGSGAQSSSGTITIGFVTPLTGPLAGFASGDQFVLSQVRSTSAYKSGIKVGGKNYKVNIVVQDSQSGPEPGLGGGQAADPAEQGGHDPDHLDPGDHQPGGRGLREARHAVPVHGGAVGVVVRRPGR